MAGTIKLPVIGQVKTGWAIAGAALIAGIAGYAYLKHRGAASSSSASTSSSGNIDPATGYPYGSPQDTAALAAQSGSTGNIDPATGYPYGSPQDLAALEAEGGYGGGTSYGGGGLPGTGGGVGTTVGVPQVVGSGQATAIAAIQASGLVPFPSSTESGMGNVTTQSPAAGTQVASGSTVYWQAGTAGGNVTVPSVIGQEVDAAQRAITAAGLVPSRPQLKTGTGYKVTAQSPAGGTQVASGSTVTLTIQANK